MSKSFFDSLCLEVANLEDYLRYYDANREKSVAENCKNSLAFIIPDSLQDNGFISTYTIFDKVTNKFEQKPLTFEVTLDGSNEKVVAPFIFRGFDHMAWRAVPIQSCVLPIELIKNDRYIVRPGKYLFAKEEDFKSVKNMMKRAGLIGKMSIEDFLDFISRYDRKNRKLN